MEFNSALKKTEEYGTVEEVLHPIIKVSGLPGAKVDEIVVLETGQLGKVLSLHKDKVEAVVFSKFPVSSKVKVARTDEHLSVPVGIEYLGTVIDPLGRLLFEKKDFNLPVDKRELDVAPITIDKRSRIDKQLLTGVMMIDQLLPLGMGQRELIVGDRKTGKTSIFLTLMNNQSSAETIIIYAVIGKKSIEIKSLYDYIQQAGLDKNTLVVATSSEDSPSLIDLTPYTAMTFAEYFRDSLKKDVLLILDDLTTHAKYYREFSLIGKRFPGRDSYPGDIFYRHAKLLERSGNFKVDNVNVSITCLPVAETTQGNLTDYIVSNLISITDGHILFDVDVFNKGIRPAINVFLSVTRVGKQTQGKLAREINRELLSFLIKYERAQRFSHFGAELSQNLKDVLTKGDLLYAFFMQKFDVTIPKVVQEVISGLVIEGVLSNLRSAEIPEFRNKIVSLYNQNNDVKNLFDGFVATDDFKIMRDMLKKNEAQILKLLEVEQVQTKIVETL